MVEFKQISLSNFEFSLGDGKVIHLVSAMGKNKLTDVKGDLL